MSYLKQCPFCGGEGDWYEVKPGYGYVSCDTCDATIGCFDALPKQDAVEAWNTRAERTCHVVRNSRKYVMSDGTELFDDGCSICNGYIGAGENYCPNCGAKVVEE